MTGSAESEHVAARHRLGAELRRLRENFGTSGQRLANELGWSQSKVSRIEQARTFATVNDVRALLDALGVSAPDRRRLMKLAEQAASGSWRNSSRVGLTRRQQDFIDRESTAVEICHYNPVLLPGYMQTEDYARRVIEMAGAAKEDRALEYRLARRSTMLKKDAPRYRIVLLESAIRWRPVPRPAMAEQLDLIAELAMRDNVDLRVVPLDQEQSTFVQHTFMVFRYGETPPRALVELTTHDLHISDPSSIDTLQRNFEQLSSSALSPGDSLSFVRSAARSVVDGQ